MVRTSTEYYRENKKTRKVVHECPHCNYETTGPKQVLKQHIHAKHTPEHRRPFQCTHCNRGFAQKAHLHHHLQKEHDVNMDSIKKIATIAYLIHPLPKSPTSRKTKARFHYYLYHSLIKGRDIHNNQHEYLPGSFLKLHDIHYDAKKGFIQLHKVPLYKGVKLRRGTLDSNGGA